MPLFFAPDIAAVIDYSVRSSLTTHATARAINAPRYLHASTQRGVAGPSKEELLDAR